MAFFNGVVLLVCLIGSNNIDAYSFIEEYSQDLALSNAKGSVDWKEVASTLDDIGTDLDLSDISSVMHKFEMDSHLASRQQEQEAEREASNSRSKREIGLSAPLHYVELGLGRSSLVHSTGFDNLTDKHFSLSFNLKLEGATEEVSLIIQDDQIYYISSGQLVKLTCATCSLAYPTPVVDAGFKVTRTEVIPGHQSHLVYCVQVTLREQEGDKFSEAHFTLWKITLTSTEGGVPKVTAENLDDFQIVTSHPFLPENSDSRISALSVPGVGIFIATFHKLSTELDANGLHLILKDPDENTLVVSPSNHFKNGGLKTDLRDIELIKIYNENEYMMVAANGQHTYIFNLRKEAKSYVMELAQKTAGGDVKHIYFNGDNIGNFLTLVNNDGSAETMIYDSEGFVKVQSFAFEIESESWKSVETSLAMDLPTQVLVVAKSNSSMIFCHHVMPGMYEVLRNPLGLPEYDDFTILDLSRRIKEHDEFEYFLLLQRGDTVDYVTISLDPRPHNIFHINDVSICLVDLENRMRLDNEANTHMEFFKQDLVMVTETLRDVTIHADSVEVLGTASVADLTIIFDADNEADDVSDGGLVKAEIVFEEMDFTNSSSALAVDHALVTADDDSEGHLFADVLFSNGAFNPAAAGGSYNVSAPALTIRNGVFDALEVTRLGNFMAEDLWNVLTVTGDQTIFTKIEFKGGLNVTGVATVQPTAAPEIPSFKIQPDNYIDLANANTINTELLADRVEFRQQQVLTTLNGVPIADVIPVAEISGSDADNPISVEGVKTFTGFVSTTRLELGLVNNENLSLWYDTLIFKNKDTQTIQCKKFEYDSIIVKEDVMLTRLNGEDFTEEAISDLARADQHAVITGNIEFDKVTFTTLNTDALNGSNPDHYLQNNTEQVFNADIVVETLEVDKVETLINGRNLSNSAQLDKENVISAPVSFNKPLIVKKDLLMEEGIMLNELDISEVKPVVQVYSDVISVSAQMDVSDTDVMVESLVVNDNVVDNFDVSGIEQTFFMKDTDQTFEFLTSVSQNVTIDTFVVNTTLDGVDLSNVMKTTGSQDVDAENLYFSGTTYYHSGITIQDWRTEDSSPESAAINDVLIDVLVNNIFCDKDSGAMLFGTGFLNVTDIDAKVRVHFDIKVTESFRVEDADGTTKDYGGFDHEVVKLKSTNKFTGHVTMPSINVDGDVVSNVNIDGPVDAILNKQPLSDFLGSMVTKSGTYEITTPVTVSSVAGNGRLPSGALFDGRDLAQHYDSHIILDKGTDQVIRAKLVSSQISFENLDLQPSASRAKDYFSGQDIVDFIDNRLFMTGDVMEGRKIFNGSLSVGGNVFVNNGSNANFFLGVDLRSLDKKALSKTKDQLITSDATWANFTAETIFLHEVNGVELSTVCFKNEHCALKADTVEISNASPAFVTGLAVDGLINGKDQDEILLALTERQIGTIKDLTVKNIPVFLTKNSEESTFSNLVDNSARRSLSDQSFTAAVTFNSGVTAENLKIDSDTINDGQDSEVNLVDLFSDAAFLDRENTFTASSVAAKQLVVGGTLEVSALADTEVVTGVNLTEFMSSILVRSNDTGMSQHVSATYNLTDGVEIQEEATIGTLDGIQAADFVLKTVTEPDRVISGLQLDASSTVQGSVTSDTSELQQRLANLLSSAVRSCGVSELQNVTKNLVFTEDLKVDEVVIQLLNEMDTSEFLLTDSESEQTINQAISLPQDNLDVMGSVEVDTINSVNIDEAYDDVLLTNREETITKPESFTFLEDVTISSNNITIAGVSSNISVDMINVLANFTGSLLSYYLDNVARPLRPVIEEIHVANNVGSRRIDFFDTISYDTSAFVTPSDLVGDTSILGIDTVNTGKSMFTMKIQRGVHGADCQAGESCTCPVTRMASKSGDDLVSVHDFHETMYHLKLGTVMVTATSTYNGSSDTCSSQVGDSSLTLHTVGLETSSLKVNLGGVSVKPLGTVYLDSYLADLYQVLDITGFSVGDVPHLAVATGYSPDQPPALVIYELVSSDWTLALNVTLEGPISHMRTTTFRKMDGDSEIEVVHLIISEKKPNATNIDVSIYEWTYSVTDASLLITGDLVQTISAPSLTSLEVFQYKVIKDAQQMVTLVVSYEYEEDLTIHAVMDVYRYSITDGQYVYAINDKQHYQMGHFAIKKIKAKQISDYMNLLVSCSDKIKVYNFVPNFGLDLVRELTVTGKILDWTIFTDNLPRAESKENFSYIIFLIIENHGIRSTRTVHICLEGAFQLPEIVFDSDNLGF